MSSNSIASYPKKRRLSLAFCFSILSGYVDTLGLMVVGGAFLSFMSGNTTRLGLHLINQDYALILEYMLIIFGFVLGSGLGHYCINHLKKEPLLIVLFFDILCFSIALIMLCTDFVSIAYLPFPIAMGFQNNVQLKVGDIIIGKSFMSGLLFSLGVSLSNFFQGKESIKHSFWLLLSWSSFLAGAILGALSLRYFSSFNAILIALCFVCGLFLFILSLEIKENKEKLIGYRN